MRLKIFIITILAMILFYSPSPAYQWESVGLEGFSVLSIAVNPDNANNIIAGTDRGLYVSFNGGANWILKSAVNLYYPDVEFAPLATDKVFALAAGGSYSDGLYCSEDDGNNWWPVSYMLYPKRMGFDYQYDGFMYICFDNGILKSQNYGENVSAANIGLPDTIISDVIGDGTNAMEAYAVGRNFLVHTTDFANEWAEMEGYFNLPTHNPNQIAFEPNSTEILYVTCRNIFAVSPSGGLTWNYTEMDASDLTPIACHPLVNGEVYVGSVSGGGVYKSTDTGVSFHAVNEGLDNMNVHSLAITPDLMLLAGTDNGIYEVDLEMVGIDDDEPLPDDIRIVRNYPNPFNARTVIKLNLADNQYRKLDLFDITGRFISTLFEGYDAESIVWDGTDGHGNELASGIYFYRLKTSDRTVWRKMTLLR